MNEKAQMILALGGAYFVYAIAMRGKKRAQDAAALASVQGLPSSLSAPQWSAAGAYHVGNSHLPV